MRHILLLAMLTSLGACATDRQANCIVTPADLVECQAN